MDCKTFLIRPLYIAMKCYGGLLTRKCNFKFLKREICFIIVERPHNKNKGTTISQLYLPLYLKEPIIIRVIVFGKPQIKNPLKLFQPSHIMNV